MSTEPFWQPIDWKPGFDTVESDKSVLIMNGDSFTFMMGTLSWPGLNSARLHSVIILDKEAQVPELWSKTCSRTEKEQWLMWVLGLPWPSHTLHLRPETQPALWFGPCLWARRLHKTHLFGSRLYLPQRSDCQTTNEPQSFCSGSGSPSCLNRWWKWSQGSPLPPGSLPGSSS